MLLVPSNPRANGMSRKPTFLTLTLLVLLLVASAKPLNGEGECCCKQDDFCSCLVQSVLFWQLSSSTGGCQKAEYK